jgi:hypothetical protein
LRYVLGGGVDGDEIIVGGETGASDDDRETISILSLLLTQTLEERTRCRRCQIKVKITRSRKQKGPERKHINRISRKPHNRN